MMYLWKSALDDQCGSKERFAESGCLAQGEIGAVQAEVRERDAQSDVLDWVCRRPQGRGDEDGDERMVRCWRRMLWTESGDAGLLRHGER